MSKSRVQLWRGVIGAKRMRFDRISIRVLESILGEITPFHRCLFSYPRHLHQQRFTLWATFLLLRLVHHFPFLQFTNEIFNIDLYPIYNFSRGKIQGIQ